MERNNLDNALRDLAIQYAPKQMAKCGDVVTAQWAWKKPHKVKITRVAVEVSSIAGLTIGRIKELGLTGWLLVEHQYIGKRLKTNGEFIGNPDTGFLLCEFTMDDGRKYNRITSGFNHAGLVFDIESLESAP